MPTSTGTAVQAPKTVATDQSVTSRATPTTPPLGTRYDPRYTNSDHTDRVTMVTWSPNGRYIASASADQTVQVVDALSGKMLFTYKGHAGVVEALAWSPDGKHLASGGADNTVQVWNAATGLLEYSYKGHTATYRYSGVIAGWQTHCLWWSGPHGAGLGCIHGRKCDYPE